MKKFLPKVSIVIPVYNGADFLAQAIESALNQTYSNIEVLVINDGSRDCGATETIAKSFGKKIRYYNKKNGGVSTALNLGIQKMKGQYFSWLSHDDEYYPNKISSQIDFLKKQKNKNIVLYSDFDLIDPSSKKIRSVKLESVPSDKFKFALIKGSPVSGCTTLIPKTIFKKIGFFKANLRTVQDYEMWFRIAEKYHFVHMSSVLLKSRIHPGQGMQCLTLTVLKEANVLFTDELKKIAQNQSYPGGESPPFLFLSLALGLTEKLYFTASRYAFGLYLREIKKNYPLNIKIKILFLVARFFYLQAKLKLIFYLQRIKKYLQKDHRLKRKILFITPAFAPVPGGLAEQSYVLAKEFQKRDYSVDVLTENLTSKLSNFENNKNLQIYRLSQLKKRNFWGLLKLSYNIFFFVVNNRSQYDFCIIRTITSHAVILGFLKFIKIFPVKTFITAETGDIDDEIISLKSRPFYKTIVFFLKQHNFINSNNRRHYKHYLALGFPKFKLTKIYNGVDVSDYPNWSYPAKIKSFIFLGELNQEKGLRELLLAFKMVLKKYPDKKLYVGGYGKEEKYLKEFIKKNHLEKRIFFKGFISREQKNTFYKLGDCLIFPSYFEGYGLVVAEAISRRRLVISTKVADIEKIYDQQIIFCKKKDVRDLFEKIIFAIRTYRSNLMNYDSIISKIDIKTTVNQMENLLTD